MFVFWGWAYGSLANIYGAGFSGDTHVRAVGLRNGVLLFAKYISDYQLNEELGSSTLSSGSISASGKDRDEWKRI